MRPGKDGEDSLPFHLPPLRIGSCDMPQQSSVCSRSRIKQNWQVGSEGLVGTCRYKQTKAVASDQSM